MNDSGILFSFEDGIARITLNRPERLNSFTNAMHEAMFATLCSVERNPALRMVLLTGAGRGFCAGQDQSERKPDPSGKLRDLGEGLERYYKPLILKLRSLPVPVVCQPGAGLRHRHCHKKRLLHAGIRQAGPIA